MSRRITEVRNNNNDDNNNDNNSSNGHSNEEDLKCIGVFKRVHVISNLIISFRYDLKSNTCLVVCIMTTVLRTFMTILQLPSIPKK